MHVFVLLLEKGYYFVDSATSHHEMNTKVEKHNNGRLGDWTRYHKPLAIDRLVESASYFDIDKLVKEYMTRFGIDRVRGGDYSDKELTNDQISTLKKEIWKAINACLRCGRQTHFAKDCDCKYDVYGHELQGHHSHIGSSKLF
jgi:adenosyl cobinamide kinase/adenosyl cobinamide phosphate guanylyltransferase